MPGPLADGVSRPQKDSGEELNPFYININEYTWQRGMFLAPDVLEDTCQCCDSWNVPRGATVLLGASAAPALKDS